jgi:hypothetical protein
VILGWLALVACEGSGSGGNGLVVENDPIAPNCSPIAAPLPSGIAMRADGRAFVAQRAPAALLQFDLDGEAPSLLAELSIGADSDLDGTLDSAQNPLGPLSPDWGEVQLEPGGLALLSSSLFEQVLLLDPDANAPFVARIETPASFAEGDFPALPTPGEGDDRAGLSTLACVTSPVALASDDSAITPGCNAAAPSFYTLFTAGKVRAGGKLFVATSNFDPARDRFWPGTVLVYDWDELAGLRLAPNETTPVLFSSHFNPTGVTAIRTPGGRELVLVTLTGDIGSGFGASNIRTEAAVDVIDPVALRIVATIPLGFAGPSFDPIAVDATGSVGWLGSTSGRHLFAIDLRPLDDPDLYLGGAPVLLDGLTPGFPDARIFDGSRPFVLPDRPDGPPAVQCDGFTFASFNHAGTIVFATDWCDGTLTSVSQDLSGAPPPPYPRDRFAVLGQTEPFFPVQSLGLLRKPSRPRVRPGVPGTDFTSPDVFAVIGEPDGQLCALRVESL